MEISQYLVFYQHTLNEGRKYVTAMYFMLLVYILRIFKSCEHKDKIKMWNINEKTSNLSGVYLSLSYH